MTTNRFRLFLATIIVFGTVIGASATFTVTNQSAKPRITKFTQQIDGTPIWFQTTAIQVVKGDSDGGSIITVQDGWRYGVTEDVATVLVAVEAGLSAIPVKPRFIHLTTSDDNQPIAVNTLAIQAVRSYFGGACLLATSDSRSHVVSESSEAVMSAIDRAWRTPGDPEPDGL